MTRRRRRPATGLRHRLSPPPVGERRGRRLFALLDDIAVLAKAAAASVDDVGAAAGRASAKAAGVIVDDTAVTPRYVQGIEPARELPIIRKIAIGSLRNKLLFILPAALLLSQFLPVGPDPAAHGRRHLPLLRGRREDLGAARPPRGGRRRTTRAEVADEKTITSGAIRTDFILSAEIMVISLNEVADEPFLSRAAILVVVALAITVLVYGVVALIVKMDDVGLHLSQKESGAARAVGTGLVSGHARPAHHPVGRRHRGDDLGRWPHPARRPRRPRAARAVLLGAPPRGGGARRHRRPRRRARAGSSTPSAPPSSASLVGCGRRRRDAAGALAPSQGKDAAAH